MSARYSIVCDGCGAIGPTTTRSVRLARAIMDHAWTNPRPGLDRCPDCTKKAAEKARKENPHGYF